MSDTGHWIGMASDMGTIFCRGLNEYIMKLRFMVLPLNYQLFVVAFLPQCVERVHATALIVHQKLLRVGSVKVKAELFAGTQVEIVAIFCVGNAVILQSPLD